MCSARALQVSRIRVAYTSRLYNYILRFYLIGSINKEGLLKNKLPKGDLRGAATKLLRVISLSIRRESILLLLSS